MVEKYLAWRIAENVDEIREDIVTKKLDNPYKWPNGKKIMEVNPMMVLNPKILDKEGCYISAEGVIPAELWAEEHGISPEMYIRFRIYALEYIAIHLEKMSDDKEQAILEQRKAQGGGDAEEGADEEPYGVLDKICVVRNCAGLSLMDFAGKNRKVASTIMSYASDNYPEILKKYFVINAPWVFTSVFAMIKVFLAQKTIDKVKVVGSYFMSTLEEQMEAKCVPLFCGGTWEEYAVDIPSPDLPLLAAAAAPADADADADAAAAAAVMPPIPPTEGEEGQAQAAAV